MIKIKPTHKKPLLILCAALLTFGAGCMLALKQPPPELNLAVPFTTQAPNGNWAGNENCEETSAVMAAAYLNGNTQETLEANVAQDEINKLIVWENENLKYNANTGAHETASMIQSALNLHTIVKDDFTEDDIKNAITNKFVVLLPLNAQLLDPSNYPDLHPSYHMVVIRGYRDHLFYINDPGTTLGKNNPYTFEQIHNLAADWNQVTKKIDTGKKTIIIVSK